jgi:hypothetical protein
MHRKDEKRCPLLHAQEHRHYSMSLTVAPFNHHHHYESTEIRIDRSNANARVTVVAKSVAFFSHSHSQMAAVQSQFRAFLWMCGGMWLGSTAVQFYYKPNMVINAFPSNAAHNR